MAFDLARPCNAAWRGLLTAWAFEMEATFPEPRPP